MSHEAEFVVDLPFDADALLAYWRRRCVPGMESIEGGVYRRSLRHRDEVGELSVDLNAGAEAGSVVATTSANLELEPVELQALVAGLVDSDAPIAEIAEILYSDPTLGPLVLARPGVRVPGTVDPFELTVRAIVGQQVSVAAAAKFTARVANAFGERADHLRLPVIFPGPAQLAEAPLEEKCGISRQRAGAIRSVAARLLTGVLDLSPGGAREVDLEAVKGIGPWTASYVSLRGLRERDAIPVGDLGLRSVLRLNSVAEVGRRAEGWRPYRGYAATYLWTTFLELDT